MPYKRQANYLLHIFLFILTFCTTTVAGAEWMTGKFLFLTQEGFTWGSGLSWEELKQGLWFSVPFLGVLTVHEFGHYFTAQSYKVRVTLPYYIPMYFGIASSLGTMGAFIRIKDRIFSKKEFFDIGIAGPLAGFVVALPLLYFAFTYLPEPEHIFTIHPEYKEFGLDYAQHVYQNQIGSFALGKNLLFVICEKLLVTDPAQLPNQYEIIHYPLLFAAYLSLFFTALNLLPIGQLDGGHILYGLIGYRNFNRLSPVLFLLLILYAGTGIIAAQDTTEELLQFGLPYILYLLWVFKPIVPHWKQAILLTVGVVAFQYAFSIAFPGAHGYSGWLVFGFLLSRMLGVFHPPAPVEKPLSQGRKVLGWLALIIFILCFTPEPFIISR